MDSSRRSSRESISLHRSAGDGPGSDVERSHTPGTEKSITPDFLRLASLELSRGSDGLKLEKRMRAVGKRVGELIHDPRSSGFSEMPHLQEARRDIVTYDAAYMHSHNDDLSAHRYENAIKRLEQLHDRLGDYVDRDKFVVKRSSITIYRTNAKGQLEMQSQARMNTAMTRVEDKIVDNREVMFVRVDAGFQGLVDKRDVAKPVMKRYEGEDIGDISLHRVAVVTTSKLETPLYQDATGDTTLDDELHLGDRVSLIKGDHVGDRIPVALPGNKKGWVKREDVEIRSKNDPFPRKAMAEAVKYAQAFLDKKVEFEYGGVSSKGVDASGFIQNVCHMSGLSEMPRNSHIQYKYCQNHSELFRALGEQEETRAGDLIFFIKSDGTAYHVTIANDTHRYIHAVLYPEALPRKGVIENCLPHCNETGHEGHNPYPAKAARSFVKMRLISQENEQND